jgi:4-hydroxy-tetrahydrodipicolinate synthase
MHFADLTGTIVPLVTPFDTEESFAALGMARIIECVLEQGADALMPTALTGESPLLAVDETLAVWDAVFEGVNGRLPIVPAVIATTTRSALRLTRPAQERARPRL